MNEDPKQTTEVWEKDLEHEIRVYGENAEYAQTLADRLESALTRFRGATTASEGVGLGEQQRSGKLGEIESLNKQLHSTLIEIRNGLNELDTLV